MTVVSPATARPLSRRLESLLPKFEYRCARSIPDRLEIFRLRHEAYLREGAIRPSATGLFTDPVDDQPNCFLIGVHFEGRLAGSIRLNVTLPGCRALPTVQVFPDLLAPELEAGTMMVDPTRFVGDRELSREMPELPYLTLRAAWLAMEHFDAEVMLGAIRAEHMPFYRRLWNVVTVCDPRPYPLLAKPVGLTVVPYRSVRASVLERLPFFRSTREEREALFGPALAPRLDRAGTPAILTGRQALTTAA